MKLKKIEKMTLSISLVGAALSAAGLGLYSRYSETLDTPPERIIGEVLDVRSWVKRKTPGSAIWMDATEGQSLALGDNVWTGTDSTLQIRFLDQTKLRLGPNSFVHLGERDNQVNINLASGSIELESNRNQAYILSNAKGSAQIKTNRDDTKMRYTASEMGESSIEIRKGSANVTIGSQTLESNAQTPLILNGESLVKAVRNSYLLKPAEGQIVVKDSKDRVDFAWKNRSQTPATLEISKDPAFTKILMTKQLNKENNHTLLDLSEGSYFWRVVPERNGANALNPVGTFTVVEKKAPLIVAPKFGHNFALLADQLTSIDLKWSIQQNPKKFQIEISDNESFTENAVQLTRLGHERSASIPLQPGSYFLRIGALWSTENSPQWSISNYFTVGATAATANPKLAEVLKKKLFAPEPVEKKNAALSPAKLANAPDKNAGAESPEDALTAPKLKNQYVESLIGGARRTTASTDQAKFAWSSSKNAQNYLVEVFLGPKVGGKKLAQFQTGQTTIAWNIPKPGTYSWRVTALGTDDRRSPASLPGVVKFLLNPPDSVVVKRGFDEEVLEPTDIAKGTTKLKITWQGPSEGQKFMAIAIRDDEPLKKWIVEKNEIEEAVKVADFETASFQVAYLDDFDQPLSPLSDPIFFKNNRKLRLLTPKVLLPDPEVEIVGLSTNNPVIFSWQEVRYAESYELEISANEKFDPLTEKIVTPTGQFLMERPLSNGRYFYRIRAKRKQFESKWSPHRTFTLK